MPPVKPLVARPPLSFVEAKRQEVRKVQTLAADPIDPIFMDAPFSKIGTGHGDSTRGQVCAVKVNLCNLLSCGLWKAAWGCNDISKTAYLEPMEANGTPYDYPARPTGCTNFLSGCSTNVCPSTWSAITSCFCFQGPYSLSYMSVPCLAGCSADAKAVVNCWCCTFPLAGLGLALGHIGQLLCCKTGQNNAQVYPFSCCSCCSFCSPSFSCCFHGACCSDEEYNNNIYRGLVYGLGGTIATAIFGGQYNGTTIQSALDVPSGFLPLGGGYYINFPMKWGCAPLCWPPCRPCMGMSTPPAGMDGVSYCYANAALLPPSARNMRDQPLKAFGLWAWPQGTGRKHPQTGREDALPPLPTDPGGWGKWDRSELPKTFHGVQPQLDKLIINYHGIVVGKPSRKPNSQPPT